MMTDDVEGRRVALLARPGLACERLRDVLDAAGAERVLEADPTGLEPSQLRAAGAQVIVVALDALTEEALDRFDEVLGDPGVDVIFEEAELAAAREGWDAARWQRHLVAKLRGHRNVLPPRPAQAATAEMPQARPTDAVPAHEPEASPQPGFPAAFDAGIDLGPDLKPGLQPSAQQAPAAFDTADYNPFDPVHAEFAGFDGDMDANLHSGDAFELSGMSEHELTAAADRNAELADDVALPPDTGSDGDAGLNLDLDSVSSDLSAGLDGGFGELSLDDGSGSTVEDNSEAANRFSRDLMDLEQRISGLELVDDTPARGPEQARGAVLVLAGLGGPDAVRQLLGTLPPGFPRPVLVQQRLDGGRYDKLVAQMQRATSLPVALAESGQHAEAGTIYILPEAMGLDSSNGLRFEEGGGDVLSALPAADSAVLLLSGSDAGVVDTIMNRNWVGAMVAGQAADGCYDPAASNALAARGGDTGQPAELALYLADRWPADKS